MNIDAEVKNKKTNKMSQIFRLSQTPRAISKRKQRTRRLYFGNVNPSVNHPCNRLSQNAPSDISNEQPSNEAVNGLIINPTPNPPQSFMSFDPNYDSAPEIESDDENDPFLQELREWAIDCDIVRSHLNRLLIILKKKVPETPLSYQTLLETPRNLPVC